LKANIARSNSVFYIYTPAWQNWSAGIRVLHFLCHLLNSNSFEAYLVIHGAKTENDTNPELLTPILDRSILKTHLRYNRKIITVYPETIIGNPLRIKYVIRWLLNYPEALGGPKNFTHENVISYSNAIAEQYWELTGEQSPVLFIPSIDLEELMDVKQSRDQAPYDLIYAQKFKALGGSLPEFDFPAIEVERFGRNSTSRSKTLELIANARIVHIFENTSVATEAALMGVPVCCHKNAYFKSLIAADELGTVGFSWNHQLKAEPNQKESIARYVAATSQTISQLREVFTELERKLSPMYVRGKPRLPRRRLVAHHSLTRAWNIWRTKGTCVLLKFSKNYLFRSSS
jgi:hypothetical protein